MSVLFCRQILTSSLSSCSLYKVPVGLCGLFNISIFFSSCFSKKEDSSFGLILYLLSGERGNLIYSFFRKSSSGLYPIQDGVGIINFAFTILKIINNKAFVPGPIIILSVSTSRSKYFLLNLDIFSLSSSIPA